MSESFTRVELLRRGAATGLFLTIPTSLLAACGGDGIEGEGGTTAASTQVSRELKDQLTISNWPLYIDIDEDTKERPTLQQFT